MAPPSAHGANIREAVPNDVLLIILSLLHVCVRFRRLVQTDVSLQYKIELVKSGMLDGPIGRGTLGTGDRLVHLRAYNARLRNGEYTSVQDGPVDSDPDPHGERTAERVWSTGASLAYVTRKAGRRQLVLSVPPVSRMDGLRMRNVAVPLAEFEEDMLVATDYNQDLLVGVSRRIDDCSDFQIRVGSLTSGRLGHPLARRALLPTSAFDIYVQHAPADVHALRIYSQYIFLVVFVDQMGPYDFQIWDWRAGTLLMQTIVVSTGTPRFTLIDNEHFAVIGSRDREISIYRIPAAADDPAPGIPEFRLILPGVGRHGYILLLPTSSLRAAMQSAYVSPQLHPPLRWSEWGSDALLLYQHEVDSEGESWIYPSKDRRPYGSRMPVLIYPDGFDTTVGKMLIIDMDPSAAKNARGISAAAGESDEAKAAMASLRKHVRPSLYGHTF
uniref:F-box domain-containing protein n=1 Tax=Ganoderma boninense TaxID=34458 RepID=A0A5K1K6D5_9APHY|nr:Uncharacterized protein [Ganoderma boninense]